MSPRRDDEGKTPAESPLGLSKPGHHRSAADWLHDTPSKPLTPLDDRLARYQADLDSIPPPPAIASARREFVATRLTNDDGKVSKSGSWQLDDILTQTRDAALRYAEAAHARERELDALRVERDDARKELALRESERRKFWSTILAGIIVGVVLGVLGWCAVVLLSASKGTVH